MPFSLIKALAGAGGKAIEKKQQYGHEEKMKKLDRTDPGAVDFSTEMSQPPAALSVLPQYPQPKKPFVT